MSRTAAAATDVDAGSDDEGHFAFSSVDDWALHNEAKSTRTVEKQATAVATQNAATSVVQTEKVSLHYCACYRMHSNAIYPLRHLLTRLRFSVSLCCFLIGCRRVVYQSGVT